MIVVEVIETPEVEASEQTKKTYFLQRIIS